MFADLDLEDTDGVGLYAWHFDDCSLCISPVEHFQIHDVDVVLCSGVMAEDIRTQ